MMHYFDNAATTQMSDVAISAMLDIINSNYGNPSSKYRVGREAKVLLEESRKIIAACIGADADEIYFTSGGTEGDNWVINELAISFNNILVSNIEHHAILNPCHKLESLGKKVEYISVDSGCRINESDFSEKLKQKEPSFVSVMLQNNETGVIQDIKGLTRITHENNSGSLFHTDAVQAVGHMCIDVKELGVDLLSASAHKFNGPKGVGFLYIRKGVEIPPFILGGGQEKGLRSGTENVACIYSMAKALEDNIMNQKEINKQIESLENELLLLLQQNNIAYGINGDTDNKANGILNISIKGVDGEGLLNVLDMKDIFISIGSACNSKSVDRSHVLKAMKLEDEIIDSSIRVSIGKYNTKNDVQELVKGIANYCSIIS